MKRIWIDAGLCDGCLNCTLACMNAHRGDQGTIYDLDLTNPANESRNVIRRLKDGSYCPFGVLKPDGQTKSRILKCDFCQESGGEPSCVKACPKKAIWIEEVDA